MKPPAVALELRSEPVDEPISLAAFFDTLFALAVRVSTPTTVTAQQHAA